MPQPTAAVRVIGDEILSGRTKEKNAGHSAELLTVAGIALKEVRIVGDEQAAIIEAVNALRMRFTYVFTSGGIGPTHDDITADAIGAAFGRPVFEDERALAILSAHYAERGLEFTPARRRMARMPEGAELIDNAVSKAPGFRVGNVHVMAGVPKILEAMMDAVMPTLEGGTPLISRTVACPVGEGDIGDALAALAREHDGVMIGSYPQFEPVVQRYSTNLVVRGGDPSLVAAAEEDLRTLVASLSGR